MSGSRRGLYNYSKSDYLCRYGRGLKHEAIENDRSDLDLGKGKLYLSKNLVFQNGQLVIKKGTDLTALFKIPEEPVIKHYGRSKKDGAPGPGTGNYLRNSARTHKNDLIYKKNFENLTRFVSDMQAEEAGVLKTTYYASDKEDIDEYSLNFNEGQLSNGWLPEKKYKINITTKRDIQVRNGRDTVMDVVKRMNNIEIIEMRENKTVDEKGKSVIQVEPLKRKVSNKEIRQCFDALDKANYFDPKNTMWDNWKTWEGNEDLAHKRKILANCIHKYVYANRTAFADYYAKAGYSAIIDPEDYTWGYTSPIIITNPDDFEITKIHKEY